MSFDARLPFFRNTLRITGWTLRSVVRSRFFVVWNLIVLVLVLSLDQITFFDFEDGNELVWELFLSTLGLSAAVQSVAFQLLFTLRQKRRGAWGLLLAGPTSASALTCGIGIGLVLVQEIAAAGMALAFWCWTAVHGQPVPPAGWSVFLLLCLEIIQLSLFHLAVAILLQESWALILMVVGYLLGHLSAELYGFVGPELTFPVDLLYSLIPDLEPFGLRGMQAELFLHVGLSTLLYSAAALLIGSLAVAGRSRY